MENMDDTNAPQRPITMKNKNRIALGYFDHQLHHRYFECNYGTPEMPWDKWFGSFHDGTAEAHERMKHRQTQEG